MKHDDLFSKEPIYFADDRQRGLIVKLFMLDFLVPEFEKIGRRIKRIDLTEYYGSTDFSVQIYNAETSAKLRYNSGTFLLQLKGANFKSNNIADLYGIWALQVP